jgi:hypothetical protein
VKAHQAEYSTKRMCELLGVSTSGYHAWLNRPPSARELEDRQLVGIITDIWEDSDRTYGAPRIHAELADDYDIHVGRKRVARLMRRAGIQGVSRRKWVRTTVRDERLRPAPDLVERRFTATQPDQIWVADITAIPTWEGWVYLAARMQPVPFGRDRPRCGKGWQHGDGARPVRADPTHRLLGSRRGAASAGSGGVAATSGQRRTLRLRRWQPRPAALREKPVREPSPDH